jgi:hypothetical protein
MRKKLWNREHVEGRVYDHNLAIKTVQNKDSQNFGKEFIGGTLDVATDEDCINVITINFTYVTEKTSKGGVNATFTALKNIIENGKTIVAKGKDEATKVKIDTALALNDFYTNRTGEEVLVSAKRNEGGFVTIVSSLCEEDKRNTFEFDMLINGTRLVEADEERNIPSDYLIVKGAVFNFREAILPVELIVRNPSGIKYFDSLDASQTNMTFTKVWGKINSENIKTYKEEESAFGEAKVTEYEKNVKEWVITGTANEPYEIGDAENGITLEEIKAKVADREVHLAEVKKRQDEYQASKVAPSAGSAGVTAAQGGFNF